MSTEPERNIEKQLKAYADKRRAEAGEPFELHQATRNMLQAEIARKIPRNPRHGNSLLHLLVGLWPRIAFGVSMLAVLMAGAWIFIQTQNRSNERLESARKFTGVPLADETLTIAVAPRPIAEVAQAEKSIDLPAALPPLETASVDRTFADRLAGRDAELEKSRVDSPGEKIASRNAPAAAATQTAGQKKTGSVSSATGDLGLTPSLTLAETPTARARRYADGAATPGLAGSAAPRQSQLTDRRTPAPTFGKEVNQWNNDGLATGFVTQRFTQVSPVDKSGLAPKNSETKPILSSFQVEQVGNQLRMIDNDGSTYAGFLQRADANSRQAATAGKDLTENRERKIKAQAGTPVFKTDAKSEAQAEQDYYFRVAGTNRTLNQSVVFNGHLLANTGNTAVSKTNLNPTATGQLQARPSNQTSPLLLNSRINGTALIGESNVVEVQAVPVAP